MFPIVHTFTNKQLAKANQLKMDSTQSKLYVLGGILPDLVSGMGLDRNYGHLMGEKFYHWCEMNAKEVLPFAYAAWLHGADPAGLDYYADECWHGGNGWCFQKCAPYMDMVYRACNIPENWALWKSHNFVEMAMELITIELEPGLANELVTARLDNEAVKAADMVLHFFSGTEKGVAAKIYQKLPKIYALESIDAQALAERYQTQLAVRHQILGADVEKMAAIIEKIKTDYRADYLPWLTEAKALMQKYIKKIIDV